MEIDKIDLDQAEEVLSNILSYAELITGTRGGEPYADVRTDKALRLGIPVVAQALFQAREKAREEGKKIARDEDSKKLGGGFIYIDMVKEQIQKAKLSAVQECVRAVEEVRKGHQDNAKKWAGTSLVEFHDSCELECQNILSALSDIEARMREGNSQAGGK